MRVWLNRPLPFGMWLATCSVIGLLFAGGLLLYDEVKTNRVAAIEELCEHDNANAQHNIDFLRKVSPDLLSVAKDTFTQTKDCRAFAVRAVKADR